MSKHRMMSIGLDLDGVCSDFVSRAVSEINQKFGLTLQSYDGNPPTWDYIKETAGDEPWRWLWDKAVPNRHLFRYLRAMPGTLEAVSRLSRRHRVFFLTTRPKEVWLDTMAWLATNLPVEACGLQQFEIGESKAVVPCDIYLDDKPENVQAIRNDRPQALVVLRSRAYNAYFNWHPRSESWGEFEAIVSAHEKDLKG